MSTAPKKPTVLLTELELDEKSLVDRGDNPPAKVLTWKGFGGAGVFERLKAAWARITKADKLEKDGEMYAPVPRTTSEIMAMQEFEEQFCDLRQAFMQSIYSIMQSAPSEEMTALLAKTVQEFNAAATAMVKTSSATKSAELIGLLEKIVASVSTDSMTFTESIEKLAAVTFETEPTQEPTVPVPAIKGDGADPVSTNNQGENMSAKAITLEEAVKGITDPAAKAIIQAELAKAAPQKTDAEKAAEAEKSLPEDIRKQMSDLRAANAASNERIAKMEAEKREAEMLTKAAKFTIAGKDSAWVAKSLSDAHAVSKEAGEGMESVFAAITAQTLANDKLTKSIGAAGEGAFADNDAHVQLTTKAKELQKADPKLSSAQAYVRAGEMFPALKNAAIANQSV